MILIRPPPSLRLTAVTLAQPTWSSCAGGYPSGRTAAGHRRQRPRTNRCRRRPTRGRHRRARTAGRPDGNVGGGGGGPAACGNGQTAAAAGTGPRGRRSTRTERTRRSRTLSGGTRTWTRDTKPCRLTVAAAAASTSRWPLTWPPPP